MDCKQQPSIVEDRGSSKRKLSDRIEACAQLLYFVYASKGDSDSMFSTLMNITQSPIYSSFMLQGIVPEEAYLDDGTNEPTSRYTERTLINILVSHGFMSGPNNSRDLPTDTNIQEYVRYYDERNENIRDFEDVINGATFLFLYLKLMPLDEGREEQYHFVPIVKFEFDDWIIMGGEQGSSMCSISHDNLPNMLFTDAGRQKILDHCQKPFTEELVQFDNNALCIVPLHSGPRDRIKYNEMKEEEVNRIIPWPRMNTTASKMAKDHGYIIQKIGDTMERLS